MIRCNDADLLRLLPKVEIRKDLVPVPASEMNEYEGGSIINRMVRKISARRSDPARLHSSRHHGWAMAPSYEGPQEDVMRRDGEARGMKQK